MNGMAFRLLAFFVLIFSTTTGFSARRMNQPTPPPAPSSQHPAGYDQGHAAEPHQMVSGYNAPARHDVNGDWDIFIMGDFIYWQPRQGNMALATAVPVASPGILISNATVIEQKFSWKPGFKVGLGMNFGHDDWGGLVEYTWFHNTHRVSTVAPDVFGVGGLIPIWGTYSFFQGGGPLGDGTVGGLNSKWRLGMDLLDFLLQRTHYVGTKLSARLFFGGRATWISQSLSLRYTLRPGIVSPVNTTMFDERFNSSSWALGPRFGMDLNWMLGLGFSLASKLAGDISYTRYTINHNGDELLVAGGPGDSISLKTSQLRPHAEAGFGLGWGSYFWNNGFHIQFIATYDFNVWWDQNVMNLINNAPLVGSGDLYTHGLDLKVMFDF